MLTLIDIEFNLIVVHIKISILDICLNQSFFPFIVFILKSIKLMPLFSPSLIVFTILINYFNPSFPFIISFINLALHVDVINLIRFNC